MIPGFSDGNSLINGVTIPQGVILPTHLLKMKDAIDSRDPQLDLMTLSQFISMYFDEITECLDMVYGEELHTFEGSQNEILLLVDNVTTGKQHCMTKDIRRRYRKSAGKQRRERMDNLYDYRISPFNRIHAVASLSNNTEDKDGSGLERRSILSLDFIISSVRSNRFGVGSYLMETIKIMATYYSYSDIVLEVANNVGDDIDEDENEEDDSEIFDIEYPDDYDESEDYSITHLLKNELTKKFHGMCMRIVDGTATYNLCDDYIKDSIDIYLFGIVQLIQYGLLHKEGETEDKEKEKEDDDGEDSPRNMNKYGGYHFKIGMRESEPLRNWYKKRGFFDAPYVNTEWHMYTKLPYPAMRCILNEIELYECDEEHNGIITNLV